MNITYYLVNVPTDPRQKEWNNIKALQEKSHSDLKDNKSTTINN